MKVGRLFWRFFLIVWLAQLAAIVGTAAVFWLERHAHGHPPHLPPHVQEHLSPPPPGALAAGELRPPPPDRHPGRPPGEFHIPLVPALVGFLASLACAAGLAWYVSRPVRLLRTVFGEVASGRLESRVGSGMGRRSDELSDLGKDFDRMAERLQSLVLGQRRLLHDVSHEMRSPLARLQAAIGLARQQPERASELLERIEREGERLDLLVGEVLALARAEAGSAQKEVFDLHELLLALVDDASFEGGGKGVSVALACPCAVWVEAMPELLQAAIDNIVRNGLRFSPPGGCLEVSCRIEDGQVRLEIADRGPGVPETLLPHIFSPFVRGAAGQTSGEGYGLGLAIAQRAVVATGGTIRAGNREGGGLSVVLILPYCAPPQASKAGLSV